MGKHLEQIWIKEFLRRDPRWQQSGWKFHSPPPRTKLELQLNYRASNPNHQLKTS